MSSRFWERFYWGLALLPVIAGVATAAEGRGSELNVRFWFFVAAWEVIVLLIMKRVGVWPFRRGGES
jgi:hypothetical protein